MSSVEKITMGKYKILLTIILPVFAIIVPIAIYMLQIQDKKITYEIYSYSLINFSSSIEDEIDVTFSGEKATDLTAINIEVKNAGDTPILKEDFERNITVDFGKNANVLKTSIKYSSPSNLTPAINNTGNSIQIFPLLLNSGDKFSIETIVSKSSADPTFDARIAGVKAPIKVSREISSGRFFSDRMIMFIVFAFLMLYAFLVAFALVGLRSSIREKQIIQYQPFGVLGIFSAFCGAYFLVRYRLPDFKITSLPEILLYISALILGVLFAYITTKGMRVVLNSGKNCSKESEVIQPSAQPDCENVGGADAENSEGVAG